MQLFSATLGDKTILFRRTDIKRMEFDTKNPKLSPLIVYIAGRDEPLHVTDVWQIKSLTEVVSGDNYERSTYYHREKKVSIDLREVAAWVKSGESGVTVHLKGGNTIELGNNYWDNFGAAMSDLNRYVN